MRIQKVHQSYIIFINLLIYQTQQKLHDPYTIIRIQATLKTLLLSKNVNILPISICLFSVYGSTSLYSNHDIIPVFIKSNMDNKLFILDSYFYTIFILSTLIEIEAV